MAFSLPSSLEQRLRHSWLYRRLKEKQVAESYDVSAEYYRQLVAASWSKRKSEGLQAFCGWVEYGLTANRRGNWFMHFLSKEVAWPGRRVLDVGCGFGGHSVAVLRWGASQVVGLDIDAYYVNLSEKNAATNPHINPALAEFRVADITDRKVLDELGSQSFDAILIMDVLEHVKDLPRALEALRYLLRPGGFCVAGIPNGRAASSVLADPHLGVFGLSLLEGEPAESYCQSQKGTSYDFMGSFPRLSFLEDTFKSWGARVSVLDDTTDPLAAWKRLPEQLDRIEQELKQVPAQSEVGGTLSVALREYLDEAAARLLRLPGVSSDQELASSPEALSCYRDLCQHYWYLVAHLPEEEPRG